jgi:hypothetical protein
MDLLRIAARVEAGAAGSPADAWHDDVIKPLRSLQERAMRMTKFLDSLGRESANEVETAAARLRGGIVEMSKDMSRTESRVADLVSRSASRRRPA